MISENVNIAGDWHLHVYDWGGDGLADWDDLVDGERYVHSGSVEMTIDGRPPQLYYFYGQPSWNALTSPYTYDQFRADHYYWTFIRGWWQEEVSASLWTEYRTGYGGIPPGPPVPLPPSVFLLGSGLLGLVGWRRFMKG